MLNLNGILPIETVHEISRYTELRFKHSETYLCAEALALYEQKILPESEIIELCEEAHKKDLYTPINSYVPPEIVEHFMGSDVVPVSYSPMRNLVTCVAMPETGTDYMPMTNNTKVDVVYTPIYNYFAEYTKHYGFHEDLAVVPAKLLWDAIVREAISLGAADITLSSVGKSSRAYFNVRKRKVYSNRILTADNLIDIIKLICMEDPYDFNSGEPKYVGHPLNDDYRGRTVINRKYKGYAITTRLLPNEAFNKPLESCNLTPEVVDFIRDYMMNRELGLRLIVGSTMSGKNTTALAMLKELTEGDQEKIVSIEMPVEQELEGVEQINCLDEHEYDLNINSLLRQNPDFVYLTETGDTNANSIMRVTNTGKRVLSTLHANSCSDVISRLIDITGLSPDRILESLHSITYQELVRDEESDTVRPKNRFIYLSKERKNILYGLSHGEMIKKMQEWEGGDVW